VGGTFLKGNKYGGYARVAKGDSSSRNVVSVSKDGGEGRFTAKGGRGQGGGPEG